MVAFQQFTLFQQKKKAFHELIHIMSNNCNSNGKINHNTRGKCLSRSCMHWGHLHKKQNKTTIFCETCALLFNIDYANKARVCKQCHEKTWEDKLVDDYTFVPTTLEEAIIPQDSLHVQNAHVALNEINARRLGLSLRQYQKNEDKWFGILEQQFDIPTNPGARVRINGEERNTTLKAEDYSDLPPARGGSSKQGRGRFSKRGRR